MSLLCELVLWVLLVLPVVLEYGAVFVPLLWHLYCLYLLINR